MKRLFANRAKPSARIATRTVQLLGAFLCLHLASAALAQQGSVFRLTPMNAPTVFYFHSRVVDCQGVANSRLALAATVVVPERPSHGTVSIRDGVAPVAHCRGQLGYATIVSYVPEHGFSGFDSFQLRVLYDLKSRILSKTINVRVQVGGRGNPG